MFKKRNRINGSGFEHYFKTGKRLHSPSFTLVYSDEQHLKVAVVVPKKVIKTAIGRNRLRRQMYHVLKPARSGATGVFIIIVKKTADLQFTDTTKQELVALVGRVT